MGDFSLKNKKAGGFPAMTMCYFLSPPFFFKASTSSVVC